MCDPARSYSSKLLLILARKSSEGPWGARFAPLRAKPNVHYQWLSPAILISYRKMAAGPLRRESSGPRTSLPALSSQTTLPKYLFFRNVMTRLGLQLPRADHRAQPVANTLKGSDPCASSWVNWGAIPGPLLHAATLLLLISSALCHAQTSDCSISDGNELPTIDRITPSVWNPGQTYVVAIWGSWEPVLPAGCNTDGLAYMRIRSTRFP